MNAVDECPVINKVEPLAGVLLKRVLAAIVKILLLNKKKGTFI